MGGVEIFDENGTVWSTPKIDPGPWIFVGFMNDV